MPDRQALRVPGRLAFETRNPSARAWEGWRPEAALRVTEPDGATVCMATQVELPVHGELVSFTTRFSKPGWEQPELSRSTLRFLDADQVRHFVEAAGMTVEAQYGDWGGQPVGPGSPEVITIASRR